MHPSGPPRPTGSRAPRPAAPSRRASRRPEREPAFLALCPSSLLTLCSSRAGERGRCRSSSSTSHILLILLILLDVLTGAAVAAVATVLAASASTAVTQISHMSARVRAMSCAKMGRGSRSCDINMLVRYHFMLWMHLICYCV
jgi:nitrate reductase gamma subunit